MTSSEVMVPFTVDEDPRVLSQIQQHMNTITREILRTFVEVDSIILAGGFGRGEGSVKFLPDGSVLPLKDYDLYIITDRRVQETEFFEMISRILKQFSMKSRWYFSVAPRDFYLNIQVIPTRKLGRLPPDIATVDLKMASTIVYGRDLRGEIPVRPQEVVLSSGAIVLFNKVIALLEQMAPDMLYKSGDEQLNEMFLYECGKTFVEICTALLILSGDYAPYYSDRARIFSRVFASKFPDLYKTLPDLADKVAYFTELKLTSGFERCKLEPVSLWYSARDYLGTVVQYYMKRFLNFGLDTSGWLEFCAKSYDLMGLKFFRPYLHHNLRHVRGYRPWLLPILSMVGQIYDNYLFIRRIWSTRRKMHLRAICYWRSPLIKIFCASLLVLYSLRTDGSASRELLDEGHRYIRQAYPFDRKCATWDGLRRACVEAQKAYSKKEITAI